MKLSAALIAVLGLSAVFSGCNMFGGVDHATTREELLEEGKAALDSGDCDRAIAAASAIGGYEDDVLKLKGWGELCGAGVTVNRVGKTLFNYKASDPTNYQILGTLANTLVPATDDHLRKVERAIENFSGMRQVTVRGTNLALAQISRAAILIAKRSSDSAKVRRADIYSAAGCVGATCSTIPGACAAGMSDADANAAANAFDAAATAVGEATELGALRDFARSLGDTTGLPNVTRCIIVNNMLAE